MVSTVRRLQLAEPPAVSHLASLGTVSQATVFTIGYAGRDTSDFLNSLSAANVGVLIDVRNLALSWHRPQFSKTNLSRLLQDHGIRYVHRPDWGIPRTIRNGHEGGNFNDLWQWYDDNVLPLVLNGELDPYLKPGAPRVALMCVEKNPSECHRHRILRGLEQAGYRGCDL